MSIITIVGSGMMGSAIGIPAAHNGNEVRLVGTPLDREIIDAARKNSVEVIYVQHDDGPGTGFSIGDVDFEIAEQVAPKAGEKIFVKEINTCFGDKELATYLDKQKDKELMIVGLQTNFCIDASVKSAFERGYRVIIPKGTNSTFDNDYMDGETTYKYYNDLTE